MVGSGVVIDRVLGYKQGITLEAGCGEEVPAGREENGPTLLQVFSGPALRRTAEDGIRYP